MRVYKLRFRCGGRQCVCYLGTDAAVAAAIKTGAVTISAGTGSAGELGALCAR